MPRASHNSLPARPAGQILLWGPAPAAAAIHAGVLSLPAGWGDGKVLVAGPPGRPELAGELAAALLIYKLKPLLDDCDGDSALAPGEALADAAVAAARAGARVLVVTALSPWGDDVGQTVISRRTGMCRPPEGFALQVIDRSAAADYHLAEIPLDRLAALMGRLLAPGGCPWDREQTHESLRPYLIEEAVEVLEAIERGQPDALADELGDVLLQITFHAALAEANGDFSLADVTRAIESKMLYRHPHVFADRQVAGAAEVLRNWDLLKAEEQAAAGVVGGAASNWRPLRKAAVRVSLAAIRAAFAAAQGDRPGHDEARAELAEQLAALATRAREAL